jgi:magnesium transporter
LSDEAGRRATPPEARILPARTEKELMPDPSTQPPQMPPEAAPERPARRRGRRASLRKRLRTARPGAKPGLEASDLARLAAPENVRLTCIDYSPEKFEAREIDLTKLDEFMGARREEWVRVRWINLDGLDPKVIQALATKYFLHPLAVEDLLTPQRPKYETFEKEGSVQARIFLILRMLQVRDSHLENEQIAIFVGHSTVLTFQETPGDVWDPVRQRIASPNSRLRRMDASYLLYALIDAIVDHVFPVLEHYGERLENLEEQVLHRTDTGQIAGIYELRRELLLIRRAIWPVRDIVKSLQDEPHECMTDATRPFLRDVYDHTIQIIDILETYRELAGNLTETYMSSVNLRLSEVMKVLTVIGTIFMPLTFLAGVYGMNMPIPENHWKFSYPLFWVVSIVIVVTMLKWFKKRGWF